MEPSEYLTTVQAADLLKLSSERVRQLAAQGRFPGAFLVGKVWAIPAAAVEGFVPNPPGRKSTRKPRKRPESTGD